MNRWLTISLLAVTWTSCGTPSGTDAGSGGGSSGGLSGGGTVGGGDAGGASAGGTGGGSAGGATAGGATAGGATAGGATAGGAMAGGATAGGATAGGATAGGATAGGATAGGTSGGVAAGGSAGGSTNQPPSVNGIVFTRANSTTALMQPVFAGQLVQFVADAFDPEGQPLTYTWSIDGGTLSDAAADSPTWYSPEVTRLGTPFASWDVQVSISDGANPPVTFSQPLTVRAPSFTTDILRGSVIGSTAFGGCANPACHGSATFPTGGFAINPLNATATYTAMRADHTKGMQCGIATKRIAPFNPTMSLLYRKMEGLGLPVACGARMPLNQPAVAPNELVIIRSWINAGAIQN